MKIPGSVTRNKSAFVKMATFWAMLSHTEEEGLSLAKDKWFSVNCICPLEDYGPICFAEVSKFPKKDFFHWVGYLLIKIIMLGIKKKMEFKR